MRFFFSFKVLLIGLILLLTTSSDVYGWSWQCCKTTAVDSASTCVGGSCSVTNHACCDSNGGTYCNSISQCSIANAQCPSGWSTIDPGNSDSCTVSCNDCGNAVTCYKARVAPIPSPTLVSMYYCPILGSNCITTDPIYAYTEAGKSLCSSNLDKFGKTHVTDCFSELSNCTSACKMAYACETTNDPVCDDGNVCTIDTCKNPGTTSAECIHTQITTGTCANCETDSDCGVDPCYDYTCHNPGTSSAYCTSESNGNCNGPPCYSGTFRNACWDESLDWNSAFKKYFSDLDAVNDLCGYNLNPRGYSIGSAKANQYCFGNSYGIIYNSDYITPLNYGTNTCVYIDSIRGGWSDGKAITCCTFKPKENKDGEDGICGSVVNNIYTKDTKPTESDLCDMGIWPDYDDVIFNSDTRTWDWVCEGNNPQCNGTKGKDANCSALVNTPPTFQSLVLKNNDENTVIPETGNRNHICQITNNGLYGFDGSKTIKVTVTATDPDGISDITGIQLRWKDINLNRDSLLNGVANFSYTFNSSQYDVNINDFQVNITDSVNNTTGWITSGRYFKFWDCGVSISGTIYDGTDGASCPNTGFGVTNPDALNLKDLTFKQNDTYFTMSINSDKTSYYSDSNNSLIWGSDIAIPQFNKVDNDIALSNPILIKTLTSSGVSACSNDYYIDTSIADPYAASVGITADFTGTLIQDPWWQANGGGVISNDKVNGEVPVTCTTDNCQISIGGLVAAPTVSNKGKSLETGNAQTWYYSNTLAKLTDYNTNYSYFYTQYFVKKGVGITFSTDDQNISDIGTTGIYFIKGNLIIDTDKTLTNPSDFLMLIVKGNINVGIGASRVDGILVANNIGASGAIDNQLIFNGSLYAADSVNFSRDYSHRLTNNSTPAVIVKYDPKLIFNMPGDIAKVLTNWQWGN